MTLVLHPPASWVATGRNECEKPPSWDRRSLCPLDTVKSDKGAGLFKSCLKPVYFSRKF